MAPVRPSPFGNALTQDVTHLGRRATRGRRASNMDPRNPKRRKEIARRRRKILQELKAKANSASQKAASTARNAAQTHGIPSMPKTNMIPV